MTVAIEHKDVVPISHNGFSVDLQIEDALIFLEYEYPKVWEKIRKAFPEISNIEFEGSWFNVEAMDIDFDWPNWVADMIENTGLVYWEQGEPWGVMNNELDSEV